MIMWNYPRLMFNFTLHFLNFFCKCHLLKLMSIHRFTFNLTIKIIKISNYFKLSICLWSGKFCKKKDRTPHSALTRTLQSAILRKHKVKKCQLGSCRRKKVFQVLLCAVLVRSIWRKKNGGIIYLSVHTFTRKLSYHVLYNI